MVARAPGGGVGWTGGVPVTTIAMTTDMMIGHRRPPSWGGGEDVVSALPGTNRTALNYDLIPTSPMEQRKRLRKRGLCWDAAFLLGEHVAHVASAEWNGNVQGEAAVAVVAGTRALECRAQLWDIIVVGGCNRLVPGAAVGRRV